MKEFLLKDCSGRGYTNTVTLDIALKNLPDEDIEGDDENPNFLHDWLKNAAIGDRITTEDQIEIICIKDTK